MMPADGMNEEAMTDTGSLTAGQGQDFGEMESGMLPSMDMEGGEEILPFGIRTRWLWMAQERCLEWRTL